MNQNEHNPICLICFRRQEYHKFYYAEQSNDPLPTAKFCICDNCSGGTFEKAVRLRKDFIEKNPLIIFCLPI